jgi:hypothetical protein
VHFVIARFERRIKFSETKFHKPSFTFESLTMKPITVRRMMAWATLLVSILMSGCGPHPTNSSNETLTVYQDAPTLNPLDLGPPGNSPGDAYYFSAPLLHSSRGGPVTGEVFGSKTLIKVAAQANPNSEKRATLLFFIFGDGQDQLSRSALATIHRPPPNLMRGNPSCARYWAEPASTWARVAI